MSFAPAAVVAFAWLAQAPGPGAPPPAAAPPQPPPAPYYYEPPPVPRYGDRGTSDLSLGIGFGDAGWVFGAGFRHFFRDGIAPGAEATLQTGDGFTLGLVLGTLRVVPLRTAGFALALTGKGGRVLLSDHQDGWGLGGDAGVIVRIAPSAALELGYEAIRLLPGTFCADLSSCVLHGPVFGIRLTL